MVSSLEYETKKSPRFAAPETGLFFPKIQKSQLNWCVICSVAGIAALNKIQLRKSLACLQPTGWVSLT
jgi:hypothetical protein